MNPLFAVGEDVWSVDKNICGDKTITSAEYYEGCFGDEGAEGDAEWINGWLYGLNGSENEISLHPEDRDGYFVMEKYLRKQPPLAKWEDCEFNPTKIREYT